MNSSNIDIGSEQWPVVTHSGLIEGKFHRPAIGLIELSTEVLMSAEIHAFMPESDFGIYTSRVEFGDDADIKGLAAMEQHISSAAKLLPDADYLDAIIYGCTSGSMVIGPERLGSLISSERNNVRIFNPISAVIDALRAMKMNKIAVVTPYPQETNQVVNNYLTSHGIEITNALTFDILSGYDMSRLSPNDLYDAALQVDTPETDAIFLSCTALRVSPVLEAIERATQKPVVTSNQALTWQSCEIVGLHRTDNRGGRLFSYRYNVPKQA